MFDNTTIVSIATPLSQEGAIGIIRITGEQAISIADSVFLSKKGKNLSSYPVQKMVYGHIIKDEKVYDEVLAVYFKGPRSYTAEDLVEIHCHGNIASLIKINSLFISLGCVPAKEGEFTKRAFLNGRIDLSQAEAVMDLISAKTSQGFDIALNQLKGNMSREVDIELDKLTDLLARIEVTIDYPDEDIEVIEQEKIKEVLIEVNENLQKFIDDFDRGKLLREGVSVAIIGVPNVGKSSLMNFLLKEDRAIVTEIAGTTRDVLKEWVSIAGFPVNLIDTAGIRNTEDLVEKIGVEKSKEIFNQADLIITIIAADSEISEDEKELLELSEEKKSIVLINKIDLDVKTTIDDVKKYSPNSEVVEVSIKNRIGLEKLEDAFLNIVHSGDLHSKDGQFIINQRQLSSITRSKNSIENAINSLNSGMPLDVIEVDLINAYDALGEVAGKTVDEDVINRIFEKFCLGK